jgi:hypothetical protein
LKFSRDQLFSEKLILGKCPEAEKRFRKSR